MTTVQAQRTTSAPAEVVYDLVSDLTRMGEWSPENRGGEWLDGATGPGVGARFRGTNRRKLSWKTTVTITRADRGTALAFAVGRTPEKPETTWRYEFAPAPGGGCEVTETCELVQRPGAIGRLLNRLAVGTGWAERPEDLRLGMEETLRRLVEASEAAAGPR